MADPPEDDVIGNWSHASNSLQNSLLSEETDSYERIENESIYVNLVDNNYEEEDIWYSAHSSLEHLDEQSTSCDRCEEDAAARACLLLEMNEPKKELEHVYIAMKKKQDRDATARAVLQLELDEIKREMERVYKILLHYKIRDELLKIKEKEAIEWLEEIERELDNKRYECITENTVKKIIGIMKKFENNENIVGRGTEILIVMTRYSDKTVHYITNTHGGIDYLMKLFINDYRIWYLYRILVRIAECKETKKKFITSEYLSPIFVFCIAATKNPLMLFPNRRMKPPIIRPAMNSQRRRKY